MKLQLRMLSALVLLAGVSQAQPLGTDLFVTASSRLVRITPAGVITTVVTAPSSLNMVAMANDNHDVLIAQTRSNPTVYRVDPDTSTIIGTIASGAPFQSEIDYFNPLHTGEFVVASNNGLYAFDEAGGVRTIGTGAPFINLQGVIQDLTDGTIAAGDIDFATRKGVFKVALDGTVLSFYVAGTMSPFSMTQDHRDGRLIVGAGAGGAVYRVDLATNTFTTVTPGSGNANSIAFDRWSGTGEIVVGSTVTNRIDIAGNIITTHAGVTRTGACFDAERNIVSRRTAANVYALDLNIPGQAGRPFVLALSAAGFNPGIPIDTRVIQLTPDAVLAGSINGLLAGFLRGNIGRLTATARNSAVLDLSALGPLPGLQLWAAAITLDGASPSGIGVVTRPIVLVFE